ncbi:MAG: LuxR family transcriptional regulator [Hyphomicrobiales bacterium]|nr:LuxR family transcriptional regulator [Hyphomicrobiales bacterium]
MLLHETAIKALGRCKCIDHISRLCQAHLLDFGFRHVAYLTLRSPVLAPRDWVVSTTYPREWQNRYIARSYAKLDPVLNACSHALLPVLWDTVPITSREVRNLVGEAVDFGIGKTGISVPLRSPDGSFGLVSFTADQQTDDWGPYSATMASLTLLAMHCHARAHQLLRSQDIDLGLSAREIECISWSSAGKSIAETARLMGITERTVRFHRENIRVKLGTQTTMESVSKAVLLGLIVRNKNWDPVRTDRSANHQAVIWSDQ